jgi:hypothetical protein
MDALFLCDREEIEDLVGEEISDDTWLEVKLILSRNKHMWQAIDEALGAVVEHLTNK